MKEIIEKITSPGDIVAFIFGAVFGMIIGIWLMPYVVPLYPQMTIYEFGVIGGLTVWGIKRLIQLIYGKFWANEQKEKLRIGKKSTYAVIFMGKKFYWRLSRFRTICHS